MRYIITFLLMFCSFDIIFAQDKNSIKAFEYIKKNEIEKAKDVITKAKDKNNFYYYYANGYLNKSNINNIEITLSSLINSFFLYDIINLEDKNTLCKKLNVCDNEFIIQDLFSITHEYIKINLQNLNSENLYNLKKSLDTINHNSQYLYLNKVSSSQFDRLKSVHQIICTEIINNIFIIDFKRIKENGESIKIDEFINKYTTSNLELFYLDKNLKAKILDTAYIILHDLDLKNTISVNTKDVYIEFIKKHPGSKYVSEFEWKIIKGSKSISQYENYINRYSESFFKDSAIQIIDSLKFLTLENTKNINDFENLLNSKTKWSEIAKEKYCYLLTSINDTTDLKKYISEFSKYSCNSEIIKKYKKIKSIDSLITLANLYYYNLDYNEIDEISKSNFSIYTEKVKLVDDYNQETGYIEKLKSITSWEEKCVDSYTLPTLAVYIGYNPFNRAVRYKTLKEFIYEAKQVVNDGVEYYERTRIANCKLYNNKINSPLHDLTFLRIKDEIFATRRAFPVTYKSFEPWGSSGVSLADYDDNNRKTTLNNYNIEIYKISGELADDVNGRRFNNYKITMVGVIDSSQLKCNDCFLTNINDTILLCRYDNAKLISKNFYVDIKKINNIKINLIKTNLSNLNKIDITEENDVKKLFQGKYFTVNDNNNISCWVLNRAYEIEFLPSGKINSDLKLKAIIEIDNHLIAVEQSVATDSNKIVELFKGNTSLEYYIGYTKKRRFAFTSRENPFYKYIGKLYIIPLNENFRSNIIIKQDYDYVNENNIHNLAINYYYFNYELKKENKFLTLKKYLEINIKEDLGLTEFELKNEVEKSLGKLFTYIGSEKFINRIKNESIKFYTIIKMDEINTDLYRFNLLFANYNDKDFTKKLNNIFDYRKFTFKKDNYGNWDNQYSRWSDNVIETITDNKFIEMIKFCDILNANNSQYSGYFSWVNSGAVEESEDLFLSGYFEKFYEKGMISSIYYNCIETNTCKAIADNSFKLNNSRFYILELVSSSNYFWIESKYGKMNENGSNFKGISLSPVLYLPYPNWENSPPDDNFDIGEAMKRIISNSSDFENGFINNYGYYGSKDNIRISNVSKNKIISPIKVEPYTLKVILK